MAGYYNHAAPDEPALVRLVDRVSEHRGEAVAAGALVLGLLLGVSIFLPVVGLTLLALALLAGVGLWLRARFQPATHPHAHWRRSVRRR